MTPPLSRWLEELLSKRNLYALFLADDVVNGLSPWPPHVDGFVTADWRYSAVLAFMLEPPRAVEIGRSA